MLLFWILVFTFFGSFVSLFLVVWFLSIKDVASRFSLFLTSFAAGALLSAAFLDLLPEAFKEAGSNNFLWVVLLGIVIFFLMERSLLWFHHHHGEEKTGVMRGEKKPVTLLLMLGDALHNFLDGVVIAGSFFISIPLGIVTSLAVFFHEIPHEIGVFGALLHEGLSYRKVVSYNIFSGMVALIGAFLSYFFLSGLTSIVPYILSFAAGNFIYISASDLIPEIHRAFDKEKALVQTTFFLLGIFIIWLTIYILG